MNAENQELTCAEIVDLIQDRLPALFFVFSRGRTEVLAQALSQEWDFLTPAEKKQSSEIVRAAEIEYQGAFSGSGWNTLKRLLTQGIAYHHAGMLPPVKYLVETLYSQRLVWVVFCTETFAAGVNFPAASAVFDSTRKWDGHDFRILQNREFYQMAGRAGRRGFDQVGHAIIRIDSRFPEQTGFFDENSIEPVSGRLTISPNTVLSLLRYKTDEEIDRFLKNNFRTYQINLKEKELSGNIAAHNDYIAGLKENLCQHCLTMKCPVERAKISRKLRHGRMGKKKREQMKKQMAANTARKCPEQNKCKNSADELRKATEELTLLEQEYQNIAKQIGSTIREFNEVRRILEKLGYLKDRELYPRGMFALELHVQEIFVTELAFSGIFEEAEPAELAAVLAGIEFTAGRNAGVEWLELPSLREASQMRWELLSMGVPERFCFWSEVPAALAYQWHQGAGFNELLETYSMQPGDVFSIFRREIDLLRQIERAAGGNIALAEKVKAIRVRMDREEVAHCF